MSSAMSLTLCRVHVTLASNGWFACSVLNKAILIRVVHVSFALDNLPAAVGSADRYLTPFNYLISTSRTHRHSAWVFIFSNNKEFGSEVRMV